MFGSYAPSYPMMPFYNPQPKKRRRTKRNSELKVQDLRDLAETIDAIAARAEGKKKDDKPKEDKKPGFSLWDLMLLLTVFSIPLAIPEILVLKLGIAMVHEMLK